MTFEFGGIPESYTLNQRDAFFLAEIVFAYLACTVGPQCSRGEHLWTAEYRNTLARIFERAYLHPSVAGGAMHLIGRLKRRQPDLEINGKAGLNMFIAALIIADKSIHDRPLNRKSWSGVLGHALTLSQLSKLELMFLDAIDWDTRLEYETFYDFQEMVHGWWDIRQHSYNIDFFANRRWDNIRPMAFDYFDRDTDDDGGRYDFWPVNREAYDQWGDPVYYALETSVWETIPVGGKSLSKAGRGVRASSFLAGPMPEVTHNPASQLNLQEASSPPRLAPASSRSPLIFTFDEAAAMLEPESLYSYEPTEDGTFTWETLCSLDTADDLTTVDWKAVQPSVTSEKLKVLGLRANNRLMQFAVERHNQCVDRSNGLERLEKYVSQLPVNTEEFEHMEDPEFTPVEPINEGEEGSSRGEAIANGHPPINRAAREPERVVDEDKKFLRPLLRLCANALTSSLYEKAGTKQARLSKWVSRVPVNPAELMTMEMARTISSVCA